jgi:Raf kinase inhibitor-like YbhB/YbcL family protein
MSGRDRSIRIAMVHSLLRSNIRVQWCALALLLFGAGAAAGCRGSTAPGEGLPSLRLTSVTLQAGQFPAKDTCDGADASPELAWSGAPAGTKSFALVVIDLDAPGGEFVHWVLYDLPASARELPEGWAQQDRLADGSLQGRNDFGKTGYGGPCPPGNSPHRYVFRLFALDAKLNLAPGTSRGQVEAAMKGHVLAQGELTARYQR